MPIEEIKRIQQENERKEREFRLAEERRRAASEQQKRDQEAERLRLLRERELFVRGKTDEVIGKSGILHGLQRIQNELLDGRVKKHGILRESSVITLIWGNRFDISSGSVHSETVNRFFFKDQVLDCSSIKVSVNPDTEDIIVSGWNEYTVKKQEWQANRSLLDSAIAKAYLEPRRNNYNQREELDRISSSHTSNTECCNS